MTYRIGTKREPVWYNLKDGLRVQLKPYDPALQLAAAHAAGSMSLAEPAQPAGPAEVETLSGDAAAVDPGWMMRYVVALAVRYIVAWEGALDTDDQPAAATPENITEVVMFWPGQMAELRAAFEEHSGVAEKNASTRGANGGTPGAKNTAERAARAKSPARSDAPAPTAKGAPS